ncbi:MAG TPA: rhodanese-like domain-containing protein [Candidatus Acidoferrales bacterium]|nr:rhodanese-like domain-containing protein [Candidatus Acidoferrales bacterium]
MANNVAQISVEELKERRDAGKSPFVLDVREPDEYQRANIGGKLIPLGQLPQRLEELNKNEEIVVHCKAGGRATQAAELLMACGFKNVKNLTGGITAWAQKIDPTMKI